MGRCPLGRGRHGPFVHDDPDQRDLRAAVPVETFTALRWERAVDRYASVTCEALNVAVAAWIDRNYHRSRG